MGSTDAVPYWHVNVPEAERTASCPTFLANLTDKDRQIIATSDRDYHIQTWDEVRQVVHDNRLELFQRVPSELRRYKAFTWRLARDYGSVTNFILRERLGWQAPVRPRGRPFEFPDDDVKILHNDWPYGIDPRIVHLVVWTKFPLDEDPQTSDLTDEARRQIGDFMADTFFKHVSESQVSLV
ncbi:hypothetical protein ACO1O0_001065 [Amphichorda felina]